ncbi:hypothetical protein [Dyella flagellata]|uniref:Uncharacterized protein n=1 Tax=Dyella flagellata TaxID=1867833 RepID=A0ABQ5XBP1_9GAMM|nr:hypothetical protein [Dyella flagellata]GLQ89110.1 hypothetical protein GCM10007898_26820 [Dyella flagellata]
MQQFIPFEDDWDALEKMHPEALIPYRVGLVPVHEAGPAQGNAAGKAPACLPGTAK